MLYNTARLTSLAIAAQDGTIGTIEDFLFDDVHWTMRWVVVDTGTWLSGRSVLLPPSALGEPDLENHRMPVSLTREAVANSPGSATALPVSRRFEEALSSHYGVPPYWLSPFWLGALPGASFLPDGMTAAGDDAAADAARRSAAAGERDPDIVADLAADVDNIHLHSVREVTGYYIAATDDEIGHVEDFLVESGAWTIRYMIADTRNWLPGKRVLVSPRWISAIDWADSTLHVELSRQAIKDCPGWDPNQIVDRAYEERLHSYYGQKGYWE